jgi:hypothetical protein
MEKLDLFKIFEIESYQGKEAELSFDPIPDYENQDIERFIKRRRRGDGPVVILNRGLRGHYLNGDMISPETGTEKLVIPNFEFHKSSISRYYPTASDEELTEIVKAYYKKWIL